MRMKLISREQLKKKLDAGEPIKLVMTLGEWHFKAKHIPGSFNVESIAQAKKLLKKTDEIVVYCSSVVCPASPTAYYELMRNGYKNVRRYSGGIADWEEAGYPVEGELV
jgi:rhodanese-related sulfurtransferase